MKYYFVRAKIAKNVLPADIDTIENAIQGNNFIVASPVSLTKAAAILFVKEHIGKKLTESNLRDFMFIAEYDQSPRTLSRAWHKHGHYTTETLIHFKCARFEMPNPGPQRNALSAEVIYADGMDLLKYMFLTTITAEGIANDLGNSDPLYFDAQFTGVGQKGTDKDYNSMISGSLNYDHFSKEFSIHVPDSEDKEKAFACIFKFPTVKIWMENLMHYLHDKQVHELGIYPCNVSHLLPCAANAEAIFLPTDVNV